MVMRAIRFGLVFLVLCGLLYPLATTGLARVLFPRQAGGSLIQGAGGQIVGSELIGQSFTDPGVFQGRTSSIGYDASASGSPNLAPSDKALAERVNAAVAKWRAENPGQPVPSDLLTNSASGLDPDILPASALAQVPRISKATGISAAQLQNLIAKETQSPALGIFGEPRVNVLKLNLALQQLRGR